MQKFQVQGRGFTLSIKASRGLVRSDISGNLDWLDLLDARQEVIQLLDEQAVAWIHDYTNANICKAHESTSDALKRHQISGVIPSPNAIIVRRLDLGMWQSHLRKVRITGHPRALFSDAEKSAAIVWAAAHAQRLRSIGSGPLSSLAGCLLD